MNHKLVEQEWDAMISTHREIQRRLAERGKWLGLIVEGLRFDIDILRHAFSRWVVQTDARSARRG